MVTAFRWALRLLLAGIVLLAAVFALAYHFASRSLPPLEGRFTAPGITAPVEIVRDTAAIPHILGQTEVDSFFGLGFVHAQDRLWQMTMLRRTVQGRLSEIFGPRTLRIDEAMRRFDLYRLAQQSVFAQDTRSLAALEAYSAGVNAWLAEVNRGARGRGAPEFFLFPPEIAPWTPADSIAIIKLMGVTLSTQLSDEVLRARAALVLPEERLNDILPLAPGTGVVELPQTTQLTPGRTTDQVKLTDLLLSPFPARGMGSASNAWVVSGERAALGQALLANDPHLEFTAPAIWYLARVNLEEGGVIGGTIPGMPVVLVGRNEDLAWGLTSAYADDLDLFIEEPVSGQTGMVHGPDGPEPLRQESVVVKVKDEAPVTLDLQWSENGPILPGSLFDLGAITPPGFAMSVSWSLLSGEDTSISAALDLMRARSIDQALVAAAKYIAPPQMLTLADRNGIAMVLAGALPRRAARHETMGRLPSRGWLSQNRWQGMFGTAANPLFRDPESGALGTTNNKIIERPFPFHVSYDWGDTQRIRRLSKLIADRDVHTRESFIEAQLDTVSVPARSLLPLVAAELWYQDEAAPVGTVDRRRREALDLLAEWNGEMNEHLPQPLLYEAWMRALQQRLIRDELGAELAAEFSRPDPLFIERVFRDVDGASAWCDVTPSSGKEACADMARFALDDALIWLDERYGQNLEALHWGDAHQATHDHPVLGNVPGLNWFVNIRQSSSGGDHTLMRGASGGSAQNPFFNSHGAAYRGVYDLADPDSSVFVISTGQSGHPLSRFYDNLSELWRRGDYVTMSLDPSLARAASVGTTYLIPEDG